MNYEELRSRIEWHRAYRPEWDEQPGEYAAHDVVQWGRSRRLGKFEHGALKAYLGVQHVDTTKPGWGIADEPYACFFLSIFVADRCIALRTYKLVEPALEALLNLLP